MPATNDHGMDSMQHHPPWSAAIIGNICFVGVLAVELLRKKEEIISKYMDSFCGDSDFFELTFVI